MDESVGTVLFTGQFWIFLLEKSNQNGELFVGKHTFGSEPTNTDLLGFYLYIFPYIQVCKTEIRIRSKIKRCKKEQDRITTKAKQIYTQIQKKNMDERKSKIKKIKINNEKEKYFLKRMKIKA